jgi:C2H2 transcription facotor
VHVNEEIPVDSLAATGPARFPRQVRTDRARPPGVRSRATTAGGQSGPVRGHQRNSLSTSSIASIGSFAAGYGPREDVRSRPAPILVAGNRLSGEVMYQPDSPGQYQCRPPSAGDFSTTPSSFSTGQNSPRWSSNLQSPTSAHTHSRSQSLYSAPRTPGRRLSVPSPSYPYHTRGGSYGPAPIGINSPLLSPTSAMVTSPTSSTWSRRDSIPYDDTYKRKTWAHPEPYSGFNTRIQNPGPAHYHSPVAPNRRPAPEQGQMRLPGIESFDSIPRAATPVHRQPSPMVIDSPSRPPVHGGEPYREERRNSQHWEMGAPRSYPDRLDLGRPAAYDSAGAWASEANFAVQARAEQARAQPTQVRFEEASHPDRPHPSAYQHQSAPVVTPREAKRQAWYQGPVSAHQPQPVVDPQLQRTSPEGSSSSENVPGTPSSSTARDSNPGIVHANGYVETRDNYPMHDAQAGSTHESGGYAHYPHPHGPDSAYTYAHGQQAPQVDPQHQEPKAPDNSMLRLEALVAVATSEENVAAAAY